jgi:DNA topoisomerase-1
MSGNLVIVESPAKAKTIERYLGPGYTVLASYGHVRDLPENPGKNQLGVDVDNDFAPVYEVVADRKRQLSAIQKAAARADLIYLATDLDREGEAIAWHVAEAAQLAPDKTRRVTFSEITEAAIKRAFAAPRSIDTNLVDAQQARRVVDRLVGYTLSPLLWRKVRAGLSAGRVQSVAVRLVVDREREIRAFVAREYWTLRATLLAPGGTPFDADLVRIGGKKPEISDGATAERHAAAIRASHPVVTEVGVKRNNRNPAPPFTTSSLQQEASRKLGFSPKRTMSAAQRLYEGVKTDEGQVGLITYMRTDSVALSSQAMAEAARVIESRFGETYTTPRGRAFKSKIRNAQEAHEAIRPTSFWRDPEAAAKFLKSDEARLYRLIWQRALASQMAAKEQETTTVELAADGYGLRATATRTTFDGFSRLHGGPRRPGGGGGVPTPASARGRRHRRAERRRAAALHRAAAPLHRGQPDQGPRRARHRTALHVRGHDLHDRRPRLRQGEGAQAPPRTGRRDRDRPAGVPLRRVRGLGVHGPDGG